MNGNEKSLFEINETAINLLSKNIGLSNTFRFLNQFSKGYGNYTEDRKEIFNNLTIDEIVRDIKNNRSKKLKKR